MVISYNDLCTYCLTELYLNLPIVFLCGLIAMFEFLIMRYMLFYHILSLISSVLFVLTHVGAHQRPYSTEMLQNRFLLRSVCLIIILIV